MKMKYYISLICLSVFFICCSKTGNMNNTDSKILGSIAVAPENLRIKVLGNTAMFGQPEEHFMYDNMGRVSSGIDSFTLQTLSANAYPSIPIYSGNNRIPDKINIYWTVWINGSNTGTNLISNLLYSINSSGQIVGISSDSTHMTASFQYGDRYIVTKHFDKIQSATIYYDSALFNSDNDLTTEYKVYLTDTVPATRYDTLNYSYTNYVNPEFYVSQFEYPTNFYASVPPLTVSRHLPSGVVRAQQSSTTNYTYQTDSQGRALSQKDGQGNLIKTYTYY